MVPVLLVFLGILVVVLNGQTFLGALADGPLSLFDPNQNQSFPLKVLFATIGLPGVILGTIVGIVTFQWLNWLHL